MNKKLSALGMMLLLSACSVENTTDSGEKNPNSNQRYKKYNQAGSSYSGKGLFGAHNLTFAYSYSDIRGVKPDGTTFSTYEISELPDVECVMRPRVNSVDVLGAYLKKNDLTPQGDGSDQPNAVKTVDSRMGSTKLKKVIYTPAFENSVAEGDVTRVKEIYTEVLQAASNDKSLLVVPLWSDSAQKKEMSLRLYELMMRSVFDFAEQHQSLNITLFVLNSEQIDLFNEVEQKLKNELKGSPLRIYPTLPPAIAELVEKNKSESTQGSFSVSGAATSVGDFRVMGVMSEGNVNQRQSTLMVGVPLGQHMIAVGTELGFEDKSLSYSVAKLWGLMRVTENFKLSAGIGATHEKVPTLRSDKDQYGAMMEMGAHYSEKLSTSLNVRIDGGLRGFFADQLDMGWFGQASLDTGSFKTSMFVSSKDFGVNFGIEQ